MDAKNKVELALGSNVQETENMTRGLIYIEILEMINETMNESNVVIDMKHHAKNEVFH